MSLKKRSAEEIENIIQDFASESSLHDISVKYSISEDAIYRLLQKHHGSFVPQSSAKKKKITSLEKKVAEQEKEIALLKAALKKY
ncbi:MAG: hypothetical protein EOP06_09610 [Proteobacteria bacterium]|nr:MAG: hypothetical protein EOP06_09610 [Pseudomonadota bacterium]